MYLKKKYTNELIKKTIRVEKQCYAILLDKNDLYGLKYQSFTFENENKMTLNTWKSWVFLNANFSFESAVHVCFYSSKK